MSRLRPLAGDPIRLCGIDLDIRLHDGLEPAIKKGILGRFGLANEGRTGHPPFEGSINAGGGPRNFRRAKKQDPSPAADPARADPDAAALMLLPGWPPLPSPRATKAIALDGPGHRGVSSRSRTKPLRLGARHRIRGTIASLTDGEYRASILPRLTLSAP